ncbi:MAG: gluconokinase, GntK/IdnK-type [Bacteroidota bacterium]
MGVSGSGKTTVGRALAVRLGWTFLDADAFHSTDARAKMAIGQGLTDADRAPWLDQLAALIQRHLRRAEPLVLACSALKQAYRSELAHGDPRVCFLWLDVDLATLQRRLAERTGHFAKVDLLASQFDAWEVPHPGEHVYWLDGQASVETVVEEAAVRITGRG